MSVNLSLLLSERAIPANARLKMQQPSMIARTTAKVNRVRVSLAGDMPLEQYALARVCEGGSL